MTLLRLRDLAVSLGGRSVFSGVSLDIDAGEVVGLIGPNGAGKTTLMRAALGLVPAAGESSLSALGHEARARHVAWMPQEREIAWPVPVEALVMLGRLPHGASAGRAGDTDRALTDAAIAMMHLEDLRHRPATELSGGEKARVMLARVIAQETPLILADEPTAGLDPAHQIAAMEAFTDLARSGHAILVSLHDLGLAARHCTRLVLLGQGGLVADGPPAQVLTPNNLQQVFGIRARLEDTPDGLIFQALERL